MLPGLALKLNFKPLATFQKAVRKHHSASPWIQSANFASIIVVIRVSCVRSFRSRRVAGFPSHPSRNRSLSDFRPAVHSRPLDSTGLASRCASHNDNWLVTSLIHGWILNGYSSP